MRRPPRRTRRPGLGSPAGAWLRALSAGARPRYELELGQRQLVVARASGRRRIGGQISTLASLTRVAEHDRDVEPGQADHPVVPRNPEVDDAVAGLEIGGMRKP